MPNAITGVNQKNEKLRIGEVEMITAGITTTTCEDVVQIGQMANEKTRL